VLVNRVFPQLQYLFALLLSIIFFRGAIWGWRVAVEVEWTKNRSVIMRVVGAVSGDDMVAAVLALGGDARFDDVRGLVCDWSRYTLSVNKVEVVDIEKLAEIIRAMAKSYIDVKQAMVLMSDEIPYRGAFYNFFEMMVADLPCKLACFDTMAQARSWIDVDDSPVKPDY